MIEYFKKELKLLPITIIVFILIYGIVTFADSYIVNSSEVTFNNTGTSITSTDVQNAINEEYSYATNYTSMGSEVDGIDTTIGTATLATTAQSLKEALNEIRLNIPRSTISSPVEFVEAAATNSSMSMYASGKIRYGIIKIQTTEVSSTSSVVVGTIAEGHRTVTNVFYTGARSTVGTPDARMVQISTSGSISLYGGTANVPYYLEYAYLVN